MVGIVERRSSTTRKMGRVLHADARSTGDHGSADWTICHPAEGSRRTRTSCAASDGVGDDDWAESIILPVPACHWILPIPEQVSAFLPIPDPFHIGMGI